jgi:hypothetical protein
MEEEEEEEVAGYHNMTPNEKASVPSLYWRLCSASGAIH